MSSSLDKTVDLRHYARLLWRRRSVVILASFAVIASSMIALSLKPSEYRSEVTLMVEDRKRLTAEVEQVMGGTGPAERRYGQDEERLAQLVGRIRSRPFLERVIRMLRMQEDAKVKARAEAYRKDHPEVTADEVAVRWLVQGLQSRIEFGRVGPGIYRIVVADYSPQNAQLIAKWVSELFVDETTQKELDQIRTARNFGAEQLRVYEEQLRRSEAALERHKGSVIELTLESSLVRPENLGLAGVLQQRIADEASAARARARTLAREATRAGASTDGAELQADPETERFANRMRVSLKSEIQGRLGTPPPPDATTWPPQGDYGTLRRDLLQHLQGQALAANPGASAEVAGALTRSAFAQVDARVQADVAEWIDEEIKSFRRRAQAQPVDETELSRLESEVKKNREILESFRAQMVAGDVSQAVEATKLGLRVEILDPAQLPLDASSPDRKKIFLAALLVGPLLGAGIAFLLEAMDPTLRSLDDFRRAFPEPVLCTTPLLSSLVPRRHGIRRHWVLASTTAVILLTAGFLLARRTVLRDLSEGDQPVHVVDPESVVPR